jgi:hypothetical protein
MLKQSTWSDNLTLFNSKLVYGLYMPCFQLSKSYIEICRSTQVPAVGMLEFSNMCMVLSDQVCKYVLFLTALE